MKIILSTFFCSLFSLLVGVTHSHADQVKVGAILPLSGETAIWGEKVRVGLETSNILHGNFLDIQYEDEGVCEVSKAITAYRKLVKFDGVKIVFLGCLGGTEAIAPIAKKDSVLLLSLGLLSESTLNSGAKLIDLATEIGVEGELLAKFILKDEPEKLAGIFFADSFGAEFSNVLTRTLKAQDKNFSVVSDAESNMQTFVPMILKWKLHHIDTLIVTLSDLQLLTLLKELKTLNFKPKIYSTYVLESFAPSKEKRKLFEGIKYTHPINNSENSESYLLLDRELKKHEKSDQSTNINAKFAYDGLEYLKSGLQQCEGVEPECLYDFYRQLGKKTGVSGEMEFKTSGALQRPYGLKVVKDGEFVWLEKGMSQ
jgi:ABC-type branched-subunit amino acid transport system substrate-binding protein